MNTIKIKKKKARKVAPNLKMIDLYFKFTKQVKINFRNVVYSMLEEYY